MSVVNISEKYAANILQELWNQRKSDEFCDVVLIAGTEETRIPVHSCVISAASKYFQRMFMSSMLGGTTKEIKMPSVDCAILQIIVQYCYTGLVENSQDRIVELLKTAEVMLLRNVVTICAKLLAENLQPSNCLGLMLLAEQYRCETFLQKARDYSVEHFMEVRETNEFLNLNAKQLRELLTSPSLTISSDEDVFNTLKNWIDHNPAEREKYKVQMLKLVRLPLLEKSFLMEHVKPMCTSPECLQIYIDALEQKLSPPNERHSAQTKKSNEFLMGITRNESKMNVHYYCPQRLSWMKWSKDLEDRRLFGVAVMEDNLFLVGGIQTDSSALNTAVCLNLKTMNLTKVNPMAEHRSWCSAAVLNGFLYAVGGFNKDCYSLNSVEKWNANTNTWSQMASMRVNRFSFGLAVLNEKLYAVGGISRSGQEKSAEFYDPHQNVWIPIASMHYARFHFEVAVCNEQLYALSSVNDAKAVERYSPKTNSWSMLCSINDIRISYEPSTTFRDKVIVCLKERIVVYSDETNEWKTSIVSLKGLRAIDCIFTYSGELLTSEFGDGLVTDLIEL